MAAFVPAQRAMTWQMTDSAGEGVVRERYWLTFQPGEIRVCASCHGLNTTNQANELTPTNKPEALRDLLFSWRTVVEPPLFADGFEAGNTAGWSTVVGDASTVSATQGAAIEGVYGLRVVVDGQTPHYLADDSPTAAAHYRARFVFDPHSLPMQELETHIICSADMGTPVLRLQVRWSAGKYRLRLSVQDNSAAWVVSPWTVISDAAHHLEFDWRAATAPGARDGNAKLWIDDVLQADLRNLNNDTRRVAQVRLGGIGVMSPTTRGTYFFDAFASWQ